MPLDVGQGPPTQMGMDHSPPPMTLPQQGRHQAPVVSSRRSLVVGGFLGVLLAGTAWLMVRAATTTPGGVLFPAAPGVPEAAMWNTAAVQGGVLLGFLDDSVSAVTEAGKQCAAALRQAQADLDTCNAILREESQTLVNHVVALRVCNANQKQQEAIMLTACECTDGPKLTGAQA